jgi:hypothetical protein
VTAFVVTGLYFVKNQATYGKVIWNIS